MRTGDSAYVVAGTTAGSHVEAGVDAFVLTYESSSLYLDAGRDGLAWSGRAKGAKGDILLLVR